MSTWYENGTRGSWGLQMGSNLSATEENKWGKVCVKGDSNFAWKKDTRPTRLKIRRLGGRGDKGKDSRLWTRGRRMRKSPEWSSLIRQEMRFQG